MELRSYLSEKQRKRRKRHYYLWLALGALALYAILLCAAWFVFRSPLFRVDAVMVEGNTMVPSDAVTALAQSAALRDHGLWKSLLGFRNMFTWPDSFSDADLAFDPRLASVTLSKDYFSHTITIHVKERMAAGAWCFMAPGPESGDCYLFDGNGFIFSRTLDTQGGALLTVHDESQKAQGLGQAVLPAPFIPNLISILAVLKTSGVTAQSVTLQDLSLQELAVATAEGGKSGPSLYFSLRFPAYEDLSVLQNLMAKPEFPRLAYIDFRVENRAYYR